MTKEQIKATILEIIAQIIPDEDLSNLKGDIPIREQVELDSMDFLDIIMELRKRYGIEVPESDYVQLATLDGSAAYLEPRMKNSSQ
ncbi:MAG: acyl carrier protein [Dehalococcoidia bacterium]|jgi:acyl carrier protein